MPAGRPTKYKPEMCANIVRLMGKGLSKKASCAELGIVEDTLYEWAKVHPEFSESLKKAEHACAQWWEKKGREATDGKIAGFNAAAFVWMTKNVLKWSDRMEHTGEGGGPIKTETKVLNVVGVKADEDK